MGLGINLQAQTVHSVKRVGTTKDANGLSIFRLVTTCPGVNPARDEIETKLLHLLFGPYLEAQQAKPEEDRDMLFEISCDLVFTVPKDLETFVSSLCPGTPANDLWAQLAKCKKSTFYTPPDIPRGLANDPIYAGAWKKVWEERRKAIGCRLHSMGNNPAVKTKFVQVEIRTLVEYREYCDDNVLSRDPSKGPALIILKDGIYSDWYFLQRQSGKSTAKAEPTIEALQQIETGIEGQRSNAINVGNGKAAQEYTEAALAKVREQMRALRAR